MTVRQTRKETRRDELLEVEVIPLVCLQRSLELERAQRAASSSNSSLRQLERGGSKPARFGLLHPPPSPRSTPVA